MITLYTGVVITVPYHSRYERFYCYYGIACCAYLRLVQLRVVVGEEESTGMGGGFCVSSNTVRVLEEYGRKGGGERSEGKGREGKGMKKEKGKKYTRTQRERESKSGRELWFLYG